MLIVTIICICRGNNDSFLLQGLTIIYFWLRGHTILSICSRKNEFLQFPWHEKYGFRHFNYFSISDRNNEMTLFDFHQNRCQPSWIFFSPGIPSSENNKSGKSNCLSYLHTTFFSKFDRFTCTMEINYLVKDDTGYGYMIRAFKIKTTTWQPSTTQKFQYCSCPCNLW